MLAQLHTVRTLRHLQLRNWKNFAFPSESNYQYFYSPVKFLRVNWIISIGGVGDDRSAMS